VTPPPSAPTQALDGLTGVLADLVCWMAFYLQQCEDDEVDLEVAEELTRVLGDTLRAMPVTDRLRFLEHAAVRSSSATVADYRQFLIGLAESFGLE
jgi:hypothetical protein